MSTKNAVEARRCKYEDVLLEFQKKDYILISDTYKNNREKLDYICSKHESNGVQKISYDKLKQGRGCYFCGREKTESGKRNNPKDVENEFLSRGYILIDSYKSMHKKMKYICKIHDNHIQETTLGTLRLAINPCKYCNRDATSGSNHPMWNGGLTVLKNHLRDSVLLQWKKDSMKACDYKCIITGEKFEEIHHLYSFDKILEETLLFLELDRKKVVQEYTEMEIELIDNVFIEKHRQYGLGVCLTKNVHKMFHNIYGYGNNTPEQFDEFKIKWNRGDYRNEAS